MKERERKRERKREGERESPILLDITRQNGPMEAQEKKMVVSLSQEDCNTLATKNPTTAPQPVPAEEEPH